MELRYYVIRRLLILVPTLIGITIFVFALLSAIPKTVLEAPYVNPNSPIPISVQDKHIATMLGLNYPLFVRYFVYLKNLILGNWGYMNSPFFTGPVLVGIEEFFPNTLQLTIFTIIVSGLVSIPVGTYIGSKPNKLGDQAGRIFSLSGFAMPIFWLALMLQILFGIGILRGNPLGRFPYEGVVSSSVLPYPLPPWLKPVGSTALVSSPTHMIFFDALINGDLPLAENALMHLILPVLTLTYAIMAGLIRFVRSGMVDNGNQEYVKTARSLGISRKIIVKKYVRRNALIPAVTIFGLLFAGLLGGVVVVEDIFTYPGMGLLAINSVLNYQIYGVMGTTLMFAIFLVLANLVVDIVYAYLDPRIRY
ncbi:MAG: ABC transporter permease [Candidatus Thermoplasmatota archaeon]|jgi:peptide/nickel transport system permease protein|nr:ABC transporter permease [Candidatus Thermoplasmatota archaeon]